MKLVSNELQDELVEFFEKFTAGEDPDITWAKNLLIQVRRKRKPRVEVTETSESVIEDAYKEHTGQI